MAGASRKKDVDYRPVLSRVAVAATVVVVGFGVIGAVLSMRFGEALTDLSDFEPVGAGFFLALLPFALSGGYLAWRRPSNAVGWWLLAAAFFWNAPFVGITYGVAGVATPHGPLPWDDPALLLSATMWAPGLLSIGMVVLLFPTGKPLSPRWNWLVTAGVTATAIVYLSVSLQPGILPEGTPNPIAWVEAEAALGLIEGIASIAQFGLGVAAVVSLVLRYRRSESLERQQIKWFLFPIVVALAAAALGTLRDQLAWETISPVVDVLQAVGLVAIGFIPVAIAIAVMRYGLYDLGRIINRTVVYGLLAVLLGLVYAGSVLLLSAVLPGNDNPIAVAMSTLAAAALFSPLRRRIQRFVNQRFYRQTYDPDHLQQQLQDRLQESIRPESIATHLVETANSALKPRRSGIWIR